MFGLIYFLIVGVIAGFLANKLMKGDSGLIPSLVLGVIGAVVGGFLGRFVGIVSTNIIGSIIVATIGAIICLAAWRAYNRR